MAALVVVGGDVGALAAEDLDQAAFAEFADGAADGHPGRAVVGGEVGFAGQALAGDEFAAADLGGDVVGDQHVDQVRTTRVEAGATVPFCHGDHRRYPLTCINSWLTLQGYVEPSRQL